MNAKKAIAPKVHSVVIAGMSHEGRGITQIDGKTTFIEGGITGEQVTFSFIKKHSRYSEAKIIDILTPSAQRTTPECAHFGTCGGCSMQHLHLNAQIDLKQKTLLEQLKHFGHVEPEAILPPLSGNPSGYRRKARLGVRYVPKKGKLLVGFREKSSRYLADIQSCNILHPSIGQRLTELSQLIAGLEQYLEIPQVEVAIGDETVALIFRHLAVLPSADIDKLREFGQATQFHIYLQPNLPAQIYKLWPEDKIERLTYALPDYDLTMHFHPLDFTQVNGEMNPLMVKQALQLLDPQPTDNILDLFCGLGNFTLPLARHAAHVVGVEGSQEMVSRGQDNAEANHLQNVNFYAANLAELPTPAPTWLTQQYDKILLDPPRTGAKEIIALFPRLAAKRIVYVSCNPATLARDAGELVHKQGYKLKQVGIINMFPHTSHIEAIALFEK
jgi:23S rRNA (uracil1939-C5)-methyltransferase